MSKTQICHNCLQRATTPEVPLKACANCSKAWYCSKNCQKQHWKAFHKQECKALREAKAISDMDPLEKAFEKWIKKNTQAMVGISNPFSEANDIQKLVAVLMITYDPTKSSPFQIDESFGVCPVSELPDLRLPQMHKWFSTQISNGSEIGKHISRTVLIPVGDNWDLTVRPVYSFFPGCDRRSDMEKRYKCDPLVCIRAINSESIIHQRQELGDETIDYDTPFFNFV